MSTQCRSSRYHKVITAAHARYPRAVWTDLCVIWYSVLLVLAQLLTPLQGSVSEHYLLPLILLDQAGFFMVRFGQLRLFFT